MQLESLPLHQASVFKTLIIEKEEYYILYKHDKLPDITQSNISDIINQNLSLGSIQLVKKAKNENGKYFFYSSKDAEIKVNDSINKSLLENDPSILKKVVKILEGKIVKKDSDIDKLKFSENKLKIVSCLDGGIHLILFSVEFNCREIESLSEVCLAALGMFRKKMRKIEEIREGFQVKEERIYEINLRKVQKEREIEERRERMMRFFCEELNKKKRELKRIHTEINDKFITRDVILFGKRGESAENKGEVVEKIEGGVDALREDPYGIKEGNICTSYGMEVEKGESKGGKYVGNNGETMENNDYEQGKIIDNLGLNVGENNDFVENENENEINDIEVKNAENFGGENVHNTQNRDKKSLDSEPELAKEYSENREEREEREEKEETTNLNQENTDKNDDFLNIIEKHKSMNLDMSVDLEENIPQKKIENINEDDMEDDHSTGDKKGSKTEEEKSDNESEGSNLSLSALN